MKKVYISGPITGHDDYMRRFGSATDLLREQGYIVYNPAAAQEKDALKAHSSEQRRCVNGHSYLFPDIIHPDAGGIFDAGIVGRYRIKPMAVCPKCRVRV